MELPSEDLSLEEDGSGDIRKPYSFSVLPFNIEQHLEFIDISDDGHLLLGSSNLVIRNWTGCVWLFNNADVFPKKEESITGYGFESPIACGKFLEDWRKLIIGEDSGKLSVLKVNEYEDGSMHFLPYSSATHHDSNITSLCVHNNYATTVSAGSDLRINVWDNNLFELQQKYCPAHSSQIGQVISAYDKCSDLFVSCGHDGFALIWDTRQSKPATGIFQSNFGINTICWIDENLLALGNVAGEVEIVDVRNKNKCHTYKFHDCEVHHVTANDKGCLAACGNSNMIRLWDNKTSKILLENEVHTSLVRWLSWHPQNGKLYSCGFDKRILSHDVFSSHEDDTAVNELVNQAA